MWIELKHGRDMWRPLTMAVLLTASSAAPAAPLQPTGKWTVDYAASRCAASRPFGPGDQPLTLTIVPAHSSGSARLVLSNAWTELKGTNHTATLDFLDGAGSFKTDVMPAISFGPSRAVVIIDLPPDQATRLRKAKSLAMVSSTIVDRTLELGSVDPLFNALDKCIADLKAYWSIEKEPAEKAGPTSDVASLFSWSNYPSVEARRAKRNTVTARLLVDESGRIRDCLIMAGTGSTALDVQTCQIFELRVTFRPAKDQAGRPVRSAVDAAVTWRR